MRREVFALVVFCTFMEDGCKWKGEVRNLEVCGSLQVYKTTNINLRCTGIIFFATANP